GYDPGDQAAHRPDDRRGTPRLSHRKPVPELGQIRKRPGRGTYEKIDEEVALSLNYLATKFQCTWPWSTLVMLCDGRIVCGCADPYGKRVLGDARLGPVRDVWSGPTIATLRADLNAGGSKFCGDCPLKLPLAKGEAPAVRPIDEG